MSQWKINSGTGSCPVTGGLTTRMTAAGFDRLCKVKRSEMRTEESTHVREDVRGLINKLNICSTCRGKNRPAELEIIKLEGATMATKRGLCEACGEKGLIVSPNHGVNQCSTCKTIHSHVRNRPETVVDAIKRLELVDRYVGDLADNLVQTTVESLAMERIAAAVGYDGKNGDELIAAVETMAKSRNHLVHCAGVIEEIAATTGTDIEFLDTLPGKVIGLVNDSQALRDLPSGPSMDVVRALGLPEGPTSWQTIELAAMETAAELEEGWRVGREQWARLLHLPGVRDASMEEMIDQVEYIIASLEAGSYVDADLVMANNRVEELEATISQIRDAFEQPVALGTDLADYVRRLVVQHRWCREYIEQLGNALGVTGMTIADALKHCFDLKALASYAQPVAMELSTSGRPAESYILDLALMALRGEVTGLDPDFLVVMREAV